MTINNPKLIQEIEIGQNQLVTVDSSIPKNFEEDYHEIKSLVESAKEAEDKESYKAAKSYFLDAASKALVIAKSTDDMEEVTFQNIARILVDNAKEMQMLIEIQKNPLPSIPGQEPRIQVKQPAKEFNKKEDPVLMQLIIIQDTGLPIYTYTADNLPDTTQMRINDVLFSGAITAVNSLIAEVLSKPIQSINIEDGSIVLKFLNNLTFVVFSLGDPVLLEDNIDRFSSKFCLEIYPRVQSEVEKGLSLNNSQEVHTLLHDCFKLSKDEKVE